MFDPRTETPDHRLCDECGNRLLFSRAVGPDAFRTDGSIYQCTTHDCGVYEVLRRGPDQEGRDDDQE